MATFVRNGSEASELKDREQAKRLLRSHVIETDQLIDEARLTGNAPSPPTTTEARVALQREREELDAQADREIASAARREARTEPRKLWRQRNRMSTSELTPEQAAAVDLVRARDAEIDELRLPGRLSG